MPTLPRPAILVTGPLDAAVRRLLRSLNYPACNVDEAISHIEGRGTAAGCPVLDREDVDAVDDLVARHTGDAEADPADWPAWTDGHRFEPSPADRLWVASGGAVNLFDAELDRRADEAAALDLMTAGLMPISGGSPDDAPPARARSVRSRPVKGWTDEDQLAAHGCV